MKLFQLLERTIKTPHELVSDILRIAIFSVFKYNTRNSSSETADELVASIEDVTNIDIDILNMELEGRFKKVMSSDGDYKALSALDIEDIPYYHSSSLVKDKLSQLKDSDIAISVTIMLRSEGNSSYIPDDNKIIINAHELSSQLISHWFNDTNESKNLVHKEVRNLRSVIDHEVQHLVQHLALPSEQSEIKTNYNTDGGERTADNVHNDYYTSNAEIRPHLSNLEEEFRTSIANDEYWELFTVYQRKQLFKMYTAISSEPFILSLGGTDIKISIPPKPYFRALKSDTPKLYRKVVKDFFSQLSDLM